MMIPGILAQPRLKLWTPASLVSPASFWVDDMSGTTIDAGFVSSWLDKSGNAWDASQVAPGNRPVVGSSPWHIDFDADDSLLVSSSANSLFQNVSSAWMMSVFRRNNDATNSERPIAVWSNNSVGYRVGMGMNNSGGSNAILWGGRRLDGDSYSGVTYPTPYDNYHLVVGTINYSTRTIDLWLDGTLVATRNDAFTAAGNTSNTASTRARVGSHVSATPTQFFDSPIRAVLAGVALPTTAERERLEGWAAWSLHRDGVTTIVDNLPPGHPYKSAAPKT